MWSINAKKINEDQNKINYVEIIYYVNDADNKKRKYFSF